MVFGRELRHLAQRAEHRVGAHGIGLVLEQPQVRIDLLGRRHIAAAERILIGANGENATPCICAGQGGSLSGRFR